MANLKGHTTSIKWLALPELPEKGDLSDWVMQFPDMTTAASNINTFAITSSHKSSSPAVVYSVNYQGLITP